MIIFPVTTILKRSDDITLKVGLQNSPYFGARVGLTGLARKGSGTRLARGLSALRASQFARRAQYLEKKKKRKKLGNTREKGAGNE